MLGFKRVVITGVDSIPEKFKSSADECIFKVTYLPVKALCLLVCGTSKTCAVWFAKAQASFLPLS